MTRLAFTLAEVLIVLGIIGIVAEMTIPTLMNNVQDAQYKSALKKNFSVFSQIYLQIQTDGGTFQDGLSSCVGVDNTCFKNILKQYLKYAKECDSGATDGICFPSTVVEINNAAVGDDSYLNSTAAGLILNDSSMIKIYLDGANCPTVRGTLTGECGWVTVDVNGFKKPNAWGKDIYNFQFYKDVLRPAGSPGDGLGSYCSSIHGIGCAAKYLMGN